MKIYYKIIVFLPAILLIWSCHLTQAQVTTVQISIPEEPVQIDPMIYGQMLENVNDSVIYGGVTDFQGNVRRHLFPELRDLRMPVMRWPGGTVVYEYHWEKGIGPKDERPTVSNLAWGGVENYQFGTDEFLQWCKEVGTIPYINLNMSLHPEYRATLGDALDWLEYVNGSEDTKYGKLRAENGHPAPYHVQYWGIGNENYLSSRSARVQETAEQYAKRLKVWASTIRHYYPDLKLLGIGRTREWNQTVLEENGHLIDFLTQHYYNTARVKDGKIQDATRTLFAPAKMEAHLALLGEQLDTINEQLGRTNHPIRLSVDEWNNRHSINEGGEFKFTRQSPRRAFDVAVVAGMLNAFIRQSPHVGMANYIFPVNGHGLIRTVGNADAYTTPIYHVFKYYRNHMIGEKIAATVQGPSIATREIRPTIDGDAFDAQFSMESLPYVDAAAVLDSAGHIQVSLVNRSYNTVQKVDVTVPQGYNGERVWTLSHEDINATNSAENRDRIMPETGRLKSKKGKITVKIPPCGLKVLSFAPVR